MSDATPMARQLAEYIREASFERMPPEAVEQLKLRVLDAVGCALGALGRDVPDRVRRYVQALGGTPTASLIGGGRTSPDRAALLNGTLVRYLDFNDSYLAPGETCHPSDNLAPVLAAAEHANADGPEFLVALAVAYHVQCRLSDVAPVRERGFDHTTQGSYAVAAGVSRALGLDAEATANAIAIAGTAFNALRVTRTGALSNWKGLAYPNTAFCGTHAAFLASQGLTGPEEVFEGTKGFMDSITGRFRIDWREEGLGRVTSTILKRYNAEIHSQSTLEGVLELRARHGIDPESIRSVEIEIFDVAYDIIGGGEEGDKTIVRSKEEADHSLPYLVAVALLDGEVMPEQFGRDRLGADDVQNLLRKVRIRPDLELSGRFPHELPVRIRIETSDGVTREIEKTDYEGFRTRPMSRETVEEKVRRLARARVDPGLLDEIVACVLGLEAADARHLAGLLERAAGPERKKVT